MPATAVSFSPHHSKLWQIHDFNLATYSKTLPTWVQSNSRKKYCRKEFSKKKTWHWVKIDAVIVVADPILISSVKPGHSSVLRRLRGGKQFCLPRSRQLAWLDKNASILIIQMPTFRYLYSYKQKYFYCCIFVIYDFLFIFITSFYVDC